VFSVPGIRGLVPRSTHIRVKFINRKGKPEVREFDDFIARIFQHEFDHLKGLIFLDRVESNRNLVTDKEYLRIIADKK
jgi:peptide deformylase